MIYNGYIIRKKNTPLMCCLSLTLVNNIKREQSYLKKKKSLTLQQTSMCQNQTAQNIIFLVLEI